MTPLIETQPEVEYSPEIDDSFDPEETMPESMIHRAAWMMLFELFEDFYRDRDDVLVASDLMWYWEEGNRKACRAPDVMIVLGVTKRSRDSFESWREGGAVPAAAFEMASERTWRTEIGKKFDDYEKQGVAEYFIVDPEGHFHEVPLQGFRLVDGAYEPIPLEADGSLASALGVRLRLDGLYLRLIDAATGAVIPTREEAAERANDENRRLRALLGLAPGDPIP